MLHKVLQRSCPATPVMSIDEDKMTVPQHLRTLWHEMISSCLRGSVDLRGMVTGISPRVTHE